MYTNLNLQKNTLGYSLKGVMDLNSLNNFWHQILDAIIKHDKVNLYIEDKDADSFAVNIVLIVALFPIEYSHKFHKIAIVTGLKSSKVDHLKRLLTKVDVKNFASNCEKDAKSWVIA